MNNRGMIGLQQI